MIISLSLSLKVNVSWLLATAEAVVLEEGTKEFWRQSAGNGFLVVVLGGVVILGKVDGGASSWC